MNKIKRTKEEPLILVVYLKAGPRRICRWMEKGKRKQEHYSRWLWEKTNGKIPEGHFIRYQNKDTMDDRIENYALITRGDILRLSNYEKFLKKHGSMDSAKKDKYLLRWMELNGNTTLEKLYNVLERYSIDNFHQLSELTGINLGYLSRIKNKNVGLGTINIKRLFDFLDKM